jgi:hypothetical protein
MHFRKYKVLEAYGWIADEEQLLWELFPQAQNG